MKRILMTACAASVLLFSCNNEKTGSETKTDKDSTTLSKTDAPVTMPDSATMMQNWQAYMTPGPMHALMAKDVGTWDAGITMWMDPKAPPTKSTGTAEVKMIMNGLYQQATNKGNWGGMPFEGVSTLAYNNGTKKFENTWIDNMGTGIMMMYGTYDSAAKTITFTGSCYNPMTGRDCNMRQVVTFVDDNTQKMEMWDDMYGSERKSMEMISKRRGSK